MQFVKPAPFKEAIEKLDNKVVVGAGLNSEQWSNVPLALRERAFFSSGVESVRFLQRGRDAIGDFLEGNRETLENGQTALKVGSRADFVKQMQDFAIAEGMGPLDPEDEGTIKDIRTERRLGLIFDTQVRQAQDFGYWKQGMYGDVLNAFPAQRFIRETPVKEPRDMHVHHEGEVHLKTDLSFWMALNQDFKVPWGPWGWGCGHGVEDVDREEAVRLGILKADQTVKPVDVDFNEHLQSSVQNIDDDLKAKLKEDFGDQIVLEGDTARWVGQSSSSSPAVPSVPKLPETTPVPTAPGSPVSAALSIARPDVAPLVDSLEALDQVHGDGALPQIRVDAKITSSSANAEYSPDGRRIGVRIKPGQQFSFYHELGHLLDHHALGTSGVFATENHPDLGEWRAAVLGTSLVNDLKADLVVASGDRRRYLRYLTSTRELWARSYAQWVTARTLEKKLGSEQLRQQLSAALAERRETMYGGHWSDEDFKPVSAAIEALFKKKGWV
jgi:hypothetical protein